MTLGKHRWSEQNQSCTHTRPRDLCTVGPRVPLSSIIRITTIILILTIIITIILITVITIIIITINNNNSNNNNHSFNASSSSRKTAGHRHLEGCVWRGLDA